MPTLKTETEMRAQRVVNLATAFSCELRKELRAAELAEVVGRNRREPDDRVCHSHDFCDANVLMGCAWAAVIGREFDNFSADDAALWNEAWDAAKAAGFDPAKIN